MSLTISSITTVAYIDTGQLKTVFLPSTFNIEGKILTIKDRTGNAGINNITLATLGGDTFENSTSNYIIGKDFGLASFVARKGKWYSIGSANASINESGPSSLSSIISYGLSTLYIQPTPGVSSLSSIVAYGLSSVNGGQGISSLSSIVAYGLSTVALQPAPGVSSLSSIVAYGLSTVALQPAPGVSSLSSIIAYGLSTVALQPAPGVSSLSSIVGYGLSTVALQSAPGVSSLSSIIAYGLSTLRDYVNICNSGVSGGSGDGNSSNPGVSSLSSIVAYGLSTVALQPAPGVSSLSSIVAYGLSTVALQPTPGVSSLSSIVAYGLSTVASQPYPGVSSLSSIVAYGLSTVSGGQGVSSLSSIVAYGLSSVNAGAGISSLSSIVAYGLSTVALQPTPGVSSLSSIVAYGLSTVALQTTPGVSSLSSIVGYGLSTVSGGQGISSLSSIVSYGLSSIQERIAINIQTSNIGVTTNNVISLHNKTVLSDSNARIILFINDIPVSSNTVAANVLSLYNNGSLIVGVGVGIIVYSSDGSNWSNAARNPLGGTTVTSVTYANSLWVATGSGLNTRNIIYSTDGSYWVQNPYLFPNALNTVAYNSNDNYWIVGGENSPTNIDGDIRNTLYKINDIRTGLFVRATSGGFGHKANVVQWGSSNWVGVGEFNSSGINDVQYSSNGINWLQAYNVTNAGGNFFGGGGQDGNGLAYGNSNWLICGGGQGLVTTTLYRSQDGINFSNITSNIETVIADIRSGTKSYDIYDLKYSVACNAFYMTVSQANGLTQYFLKSTNNGTSWTNLRSNVGSTIYRSALGFGTGPISNTSPTSITNGVVNTVTLISCNIDTTTIYSQNIYIANTLTVDTIYVSTIPFVSYGLSSLHFPTGISSLSSIVAYGLSTVAAQPAPGVSSLSSIVAYGLSTVFIGSQQLQSNTYNYTFQQSSIGGTEIVDKKSNINNPDTITNAFAKVDNWLFTNMIAPPPVSIFVSSNNTPISCKVTWQNPYQFLTGFLAQPFPYINKLYINISNGDGSFVVNSNITTASNMPFPGNTNVISNVLLTIDTATYTSGYSSDNTYIIANSAATGKTNFTFNITWLNNNTSLASNTLVIPNINFTAASPPTAPTALAASEQTNVAITFTYSAPTTLNGPLANYSNVLVTFCNLGYTNTFNSNSSNQPGPRRFGVPFTSITQTSNTSATTVTFTGLTPDTPVSLSSSAKNTINANYGTSSNIYSRTTLPAAPNRLGALVFTNYYTYNGIPVTSRVSGDTPVSIINSNTISGTYLTTTVQSSVAIHTLSNPGSTSNSIMAITCSNVGPIFFNGYGGIQLSSNSYRPDSNFLIQFNGSNDLYAANTGSNGFYSIASLQFGVSKHFIVPSVNSYTFTTTQSNEFVTPNVSLTNTLYVDLINTTPSNLQSYNSINTPGTPYFFCSGVLSFTSNVVVNSIFSVSNIASYYITHPTIGTYTIGTGTTSNIPTNTTFYSDLALANTIQTTTILVNSNVFITNNLFNLGNQQLFTNRLGVNFLYLTTTFSNIFGNGSTKTNEFQIYNEGFSNIYFDIPSKVILDSMSSSNNTYGIRVESGSNSGSDVLGFGGFFNQSNSLLGTYSNEIQLVNGFFQTDVSSTDGYINYGGNNFYNPLVGSYTYPDYTSITSGVRYLTVQYYINVTSQSYLFFSLNIDTPTNFSIDGNSYLTNNITVQYKIVDPTKPDPNDSSSITTAWLNGNLSGTAVTSGTKNTAGNPGFLSAPSRGGTTYTSTTSTRYLQVVSGTGDVPFITYIRFGVPLTQNIRWKRLSLTFI